MTVLVEPVASVYYDRSRLGVIFARGRKGFEAYAADDHSLGLFPSEAITDKAMNNATNVSETILPWKWTTKCSPQSMPSWCS